MAMCHRAGDSCSSAALSVSQSESESTQSVDCSHELPGKGVARVGEGRGELCGDGKKAVLACSVIESVSLGLAYDGRGARGAARAVRYLLTNVSIHSAFTCPGGRSAEATGERLPYHYDK